MQERKEVLFKISAVSVFVAALFVDGSLCLAAIIMGFALVTGFLAEHL